MEEKTYKQKPKDAKTEYTFVSRWMINEITNNMDEVMPEKSLCLPGVNVDSIVISRANRYIAVDLNGYLERDYCDALNKTLDSEKPLCVSLTAELRNDSSLVGKIFCLRELEKNELEKAINLYIELFIDEYGESFLEYPMKTDITACLYGKPDECIPINGPYMDEVRYETCTYVNFHDYREVEVASTVDFSRMSRTPYDYKILTFDL